MPSKRLSFAATIWTLGLAGFLAPGGSLTAASAGPPRTHTAARTARGPHPPARATRARPTPLDARGMWIWYLKRSEGGNIDAIAARAHAAGVKTLLIKSGDGTNYWSQFTRGLVNAFRARGLRVCAWQYIYGTDPVGEALIARRAIRAGAECFVIDAEAEYEGRYASAQRYLQVLRRGVGRGYPLGLASFPFVDYHPAFPYSVFLGPGGAQFDLPQMYWRDIAGTVVRVFDHTYTQNRIYRRLIRPVGQTYGSPGADEMRSFRALTVRFGSTGISWWDFAWTTAAGLWPAIGGSLGSTAGAAIGWPSLAHGSQGDNVLWLQEHLARIFPTLRTTGLFGPQTRADLRAFQAARGLVPSGRTDASTWRLLLRVRPVAVRWQAGSTISAVAAAAGLTRGGRFALTGGARAPASAALPARAREIPELGSSLGPDAAHAEP